MGERPGGRQEAALRILGVEARLDGVAGQRDLLLGQRQRLARRDPELPLDQIEPGDHLGDRMLDLKTRVHLHEIERAALIHQELDRAGVGVPDRRREAHRRGAERRALLAAERRRRRLLEHLLVAPLHRAVALEQMHHVAVVVAEHLHLDVARRLEVALEQHALVAERRQRLAPRPFERRRRSHPAARPRACPCRRRRPPP